MRTRTYALGTVGAIGAIIIWQLVAVLAHVGDALPTPAATLEALIDQLGMQVFWLSVMNTLIVALEGLAIGIVAGTVLGLVIGSSVVLSHATRAVLEFLKPIPPIVILPLAVLVLGPTQQMALFLIVFNCTLTIIHQTANGVRETDPVTIDTGRSYGLSNAEITRRIVVPSASAFIATGVRITMPAALVITVVAGLLGGGPGLGHDIYQANSASNFATLYAFVIVLGVLGLLFEVASKALERRVLHWHPLHRVEIN